jgi:outer membrane immunogenic protein
MNRFFAISLFVFTGFTSAAAAQSTPLAPLEIEAGYNYLHTNAPPKDCGCFSMNGGEASAAYRLHHSFSAVALFQGVTNGNVNDQGRSLTLTSYTFGGRYTYHFADHRLAPFGQVLVGAAHADGSLYAKGSASSGSATAFASSIGGGADVTLTPRISLRVVQVDYLLTLLPNGVNDRQNNLSVSTGIVFHVGRR